MEKEEIKRIIEALLFVSDKPISIDTMRDVIAEVEPAEIRALMEELNKEYAESGRSFAIKEIAGGFQMLTDPIYSKWISAMYKRPPDRLSGPALETLAIIAYKQPITRGEIEAIRGVNVERIVHTLEERGLIRTKGRLETPGRPILYGTTTEFLQHFGLRSLDELPNLKEFQESDLDFIRERARGQMINQATGEAEDADGIDHKDLFTGGLTEIQNTPVEIENAESSDDATDTMNNTPDTIDTTKEVSDGSKEAA